MRKGMYMLMAALVLILPGCSTQTKEPQFVSTSVHQEFLENGVVTGTDDYYYTRNDQGLVTDGERWEDGLLTEQTHWDYDDWGNPVRITTKGTMVNQISEYKNALDEEGRILRREGWTNGALTSVREITYNRHGKEATHHVTAWHEDGQLDGSGDYTMTYNWKGQLTRQVHLLASGAEYVWEYQDGLCVRETSYEAESHAITYYWEYTYDEKDRCIRETRYAGDGTLELYHEYVYDEEARTKTRTCYYADGTADNYSDVYSYDEYGNEVLLEKLRDGEVYWRIQYNYALLETAEERS